MPGQGCNGAGCRNQWIWRWDNSNESIKTVWSLWQCECERRRSRIPASRTLPTKLCQAAVHGCSSFFFPSIGTRPGNPGIFLSKFTQKFLQLYTFLSHMYLCLRSLKFVAAQELQRVLERGPEGQQDKTGTEVITAMQSNVLQHRCASRKRHASQCTTIDDIIWQYLIKFVHSRFCLELPRVQKTNWKGTCIKEPTSQSASGCSTKRSKR